MITYNKIIKLFENIASSNKFINKFGNGDISLVDTKIKDDDNYPVLWVVPQSVALNGNAIEYRVRVIVFDIDNLDDSNQQDILSDTIQILIDVVNTFNSSLEDYSEVVVNENIEFEPFTEKFSEYCTGWWGTLSIFTSYNNNECSLPNI